MSIRWTVVVAALSCLVLVGCSEESPDDLATATTTNAVGNGPAAGQAGRPPASPPSTIEPINFLPSTLARTIPACEGADCKVVGEVAGLPSAGGPVSVVAIRRTAPTGVTDTVAVLDKAGTLLWAAPNPIPPVDDSVEMVLDGTGNVLIPVTLADGSSQVFVVGVRAKSINDYLSFGSDSPFRSEAPADIADSNGDGYREIRVTRGSNTVEYQWNGGQYVVGVTPSPAK